MIDRRKVTNIFDESFFADRKGCVDLLLQEGNDIFGVNKNQEVPFPQGRLSSSPDFLSWWYEKQAKESGAMQKSLTNAANAFSVTATLVATASFVGPLQPPKGYTEDNQMEFDNIWVSTFIFYNNFSFYLGIVAIVLSLIPALPMRQQAMFDELRRTRNMVTVSIGLLFPSIVSILVAFTASSFAVVTPPIMSTRGRNLAAPSLSIGGLFVLFSSRFACLGFVSQRTLGSNICTRKHLFNEYSKRTDLTGLILCEDGWKQQMWSISIHTDCSSGCKMICGYKFEVGRHGILPRSSYTPLSSLNFHGSKVVVD